MASTTAAELEQYLNGLLAAAQFKDYGPNGLQVEGARRIGRIVSGVTASRDFIDAAVAAGADALLVHHGLFWRGHDGRLTGWLRERVARLMANNVHLFAYHLPLDAHAEFGNNVGLGARLGWVADRRFGEQTLGFSAPIEPQSLDGLALQVEQALGRVPVCVPGDGRLLRRVAWCTGGAQGYFEAAVAAGADVFLTGEISEPQFHLARETGVAFVAAGHHATERDGVRLLGEHLAQRFGIEHRFIDLPNPA